MKIAHVGPAILPILFPRGGAVERRMVELARVQATEGHEVTVYSAEDLAAERIVDGFRLRTLQCGSSGWPRALHFLWQAGRELRQTPVDLIHFHNMPEGIWFTRGATSVKFLSYDYFHSRRWEHRPAFMLYRQTLQQYDRLLPVSEFCLAGSRAFWNLPADRMRVLHNGVNVDQFAPDEDAAAGLKQRLGLTDAPIVLSVGRVCEQKGSHVLVAAYERLRAHRPEVQLVVAGPAGQFGNTGSNELVRRIEAAGGRYLGAVDEPDLAATYNLASVYAMATVRDEMFGMAAIEAQSCGKPVICSEQGGLPEVVPLASGMHFPPGDSAALAECLERLLNDEMLRVQLASAARPNAMRFSWPTIAGQIAALYREVREEKTHPPPDP